MAERADREDESLRKRIEGALPAVGRGDFHRQSTHVRTPLPALAPGTVVAEFTLLELIGEGGMGQVWLAEQSTLGDRKVALKFVRADRVSSRTVSFFEREARAGGRLNHPGIVTVHASGESSGHRWIAMEYVDGHWNLRDYLDEVASTGELPKGYDQHVALFIAGVADAMQFAHEAGVIHRDLKPRNILIRPDSTPAVSDFGLARITDETELSQTGDFAGTYAYMSPEQVAARRAGIDHRTDVFSLGTILYEMLSLRRPFEGETTHQLAQEILVKQPPDLRGVRRGIPAALAAICEKAMQKDRDQRYATMTEFGRDLRAFLANESVSASVVGRRATTHLEWWLITSLVVVAMLVISGQSDFWRSSEAHTSTNEESEETASSDLVLHSRSEWSSTLPDPAKMKALDSIERITLHYSATPETGTPTDRSKIVDALQLIEAEHKDRGWGTIGYHYLLDGRGEVWEGRPLTFEGAHAGGENNLANIGVCVIMASDDELPAVVLDKLSSFLDELRAQHDVKLERLFGHRDFKATVCPGPQLTRFLKEYKSLR